MGYLLGGFPEEEVRCVCDPQNAKIFVNKRTSYMSAEESVGDNSTYHKVAEPPNLGPSSPRKPQGAQIAGIPNATDVPKDSQCSLVIAISETDGTASTTARARISLPSDWSLFLLSLCSE
ncbi:hypothetical protein NPIL_435981 [Nephila pilipes]|uniref:Uncharacterized protein n=1 Tax=Nephila pilipes TaxID=299642 RepID=A0A8X6J3Q4_NEPPI|nr:hypothetical protein NPIL_435981 [Nephila pilipes]